MFTLSKRCQPIFLHFTHGSSTWNADEIIFGINFLLSDSTNYKDHQQNLFFKSALYFPQADMYNGSFYCAMFKTTPIDSSSSLFLYLVFFFVGNFGQSDLNRHMKHLYSKKKAPGV